MAKTKNVLKEAKVTRPHIVQFRLTEADYLRLKTEAQTVGIEPNECARMKTTGGAVMVRQFSELPFAVMHELGRIGQNLNQIARRLNTTEEHDPARLAETCERMDEVLTVILAAITG